MTRQALDAERAHLAGLYANAARFLRHSREALGILPLHGDFAEELTAIVGNLDLLIQNP
jgi:hypothetical protein